MGEEKNSNKIKMFLFLIFAILLIAFFAYTVRIIQDMFININNKNLELKCNTLDYSLDAEYNNNRLILLLSNQDYTINLTRITIISDTSENEYTLNITPNLIGGDSISIVLDNISINKGFNSYVEICKEKKKYQTISK